jgi:hypothetical protein
MSTSPQVLTATGLITALEAGREVEIDLSGVLMDDQGNDVPCTHAWAAHDCVAFRVGVPEGSSIFVVNKSAVDLVDVAWRAEHRHTVERDENESAQPAVVAPSTIIELARRPLVNGNFQIDAELAAPLAIPDAWVDLVLDEGSIEGNLVDAEVIDVATPAIIVNCPGAYSFTANFVVEVEQDGIPTPVFGRIVDALGNTVAACTAYKEVFLGEPQQPQRRFDMTASGVAHLDAAQIYTVQIMGTDADLELLVAARITIKKH